MSIFSKYLSEKTKANLFLRYFALTRVPMIFYTRASVVDISDEKIAVKIPLRRRTKNHLQCMYFGALAIGADVCGGTIAMLCIDKSKQKMALIFKSMNVNFLKRAEGDTYFTCAQGKELSVLIDKAATSGERMEMPVNIIATVPDKLGDEPVAEFDLVISIKRRT